MLVLRCAVPPVVCLGTEGVHAHEYVSVPADRHQRGDAEQAEQLLPAVQKEVLQAARADAVLCQDGKGEVPRRKTRSEKMPNKLQGRGSTASSGKTFHS